MLAERLDEVISQCAVAAEPANLAKYTFNLARAFNLFYHRHRIIAEEDPVQKGGPDRTANITRSKADQCSGNFGNIGTGTNVMA